MHHAGGRLVVPPPPALGAPSLLFLHPPVHHVPLGCCSPNPDAALCAPPAAPQVHYRLHSPPEHPDSPFGHWLGAPLLHTRLQAAWALQAVLFSTAPPPSAGAGSRIRQEKLGRGRGSLESPAAAVATPMWGALGLTCGPPVGQPRTKTYALCLVKAY